MFNKWCSIEYISAFLTFDTIWHSMSSINHLGLFNITSRRRHNGRFDTEQLHHGIDYPGTSVYIARQQSLFQGFIQYSSANEALCEADTCRLSAPMLGPDTHGGCRDPEGYIDCSLRSLRDHHLAIGRTEMKIRSLADTFHIYM